MLSFQRDKPGGGGHAGVASWSSQSGPDPTKKETLKLHKGLPIAGTGRASPAALLDHGPKRLPTRGRPGHQSRDPACR